MRRDNRFALLTAGLLVACWDATWPTTPPALPAAPPRPAISDAAHGAAGSAHFYFLPPMVAAPSYRGAFDPSRAPVVEICRWSGAGCSLPLVTTFTTDPLPGSETIRVSSADELYVVNWHTDQYAAEEGATYRIRVLVDGAELGFADVQVVRSTGKARNASSGETIMLVDGRTLPIKFRIERFALFPLGAEGGSVSTGETAEGGVTLDVPAGALAGPLAITVAPTAPLVADPGLVAGAVYEFGPDGTEFATPITVTIKYDPAKLPAGYRQEDVRLFTSVKTDGVVTGWEQAEQSTVDLESHTVTGLVHHFTQGAALALVPVATVAATPDTLRLLRGWGDKVGAVPLAQNGDTLTGRTTVWTSLDPAVADVFSIITDVGDSTGHVTAVGLGATGVVATIGNASDTVWVIVRDRVDAVQVNPPDPGIAVGGQLAFSTTVLGSLGGVLTDREVSWRVVNPAVATIDQSGVATGLAVGTAEVRATVASENVSGSTVLRVGSFADLAGAASLGASGGSRTCALTAVGAAYCWGSATAQDFLPSYAAVPLSGSIAFQSIATGGGHACGIATSGDTYCWGSHGVGQLGIGGGFPSSRYASPVRVSTSEGFTSVTPGGAFTCALTDAGAAWCWGYNWSGQLGNGATQVLVNGLPVPVAGGHVFTQLDAGDYHACALDSAGAAWCWGTGYGATPTRVPGTYSAIAAGGEESCALDALGAAYCWRSPTTVAAVGGLPALASISVGRSKCGLTPGGVAWCWGDNRWGQLGTGVVAGSADPAPPAPVATGLTFSALVAGGSGGPGHPGHACGLTIPAGQVVCWGSNASGELGNASLTTRALPVNVIRPQ